MFMEQALESVFVLPHGVSIQGDLWRCVSIQEFKLFLKLYVLKQFKTTWLQTDLHFKCEYWISLKDAAFYWRCRWCYTNVTVCVRCDCSEIQAFWEFIEFAGFMMK